MGLDRELETYKSHQTELVLEAEGRYVLIHESQIDKFDTYGEATEAG